MSDNAQIVADSEVSAEQAPVLADVVRAWLVGEQIIEQEESDSVLGGAGHRPGIRYRTANAGGNGIELRCDACGVSFEPDDSWSDAVGAWFSGDDLASFPCPSCSQQVFLTEWRRPLPWGFGHLGIKFWNWPPLSDDFVHAFTRKLGHRTVMVRLVL